MLRQRRNFSYAPRLYAAVRSAPWPSAPCHNYQLCNLHRVANIPGNPDKISSSPRNLASFPDPKRQ